ncbi:MAG: hypothetical protein ABS81_16475 [Pseudonocardia sp. SCN 72-86]|nr:MAG: hypothetical protein ABS81_16475 [Pseudonocardia sp. SCN 72-86]
MERPNFVADERHGPLPAVLLVLTVVSGLIDAISILALGHVFVANMTGNVVFVGFAIAGAMIGGRMPDRWGRSRPSCCATACVLLEIVLIGACLVISIFVHLREVGPIAATVAVALAIAMGIQNVSTRRMGVPGVTTTLLTMTLTSFAADRGKFAESAQRRIAVIATMMGGTILVLHVDTRSAFIAVLVLLVGVAVTLTAVARDEQPWHA